MLLVASLLVVGTIFYVLVEGWGVVDALYFCAMSLATVGYGDVVPETEDRQALHGRVRAVRHRHPRVVLHGAERRRRWRSSAHTAVRATSTIPPNGRRWAKRFSGAPRPARRWSPAGWWRCAFGSATSCWASSWPSARACSSAPSRTSSWRRRSTRRRGAAAWRSGSSLGASRSSSATSSSTGCGGGPQALAGEPRRRRGARDRAGHRPRRHPGVDRARAHGAQRRRRQRRDARGGLPLQPARIDRRHGGAARAGWPPGRIIRAVAPGRRSSPASHPCRLRAPRRCGPRTIAFVLAFAGGAILTMLADTMMPEAFEHGGARSAWRRRRLRSRVRDHRARVARMPACGPWHVRMYRPYARSGMRRSTGATSMRSTRSPHPSF